MAAAGVRSISALTRASEGAGRRGMAILGAEPNTAAAERLPDRRSKARRRADEESTRCGRGGPRRQPRGPAEPVGKQPVHLPIAATSCLRQPFPLPFAYCSAPQRADVAAPPGVAMFARSRHTGRRPSSPRGRPLTRPSRV